jgi:hypothetical protein
MPFQNSFWLEQEHHIVKTLATLQASSENRQRQFFQA